MRWRVLWHRDRGSSPGDGDGAGRGAAKAETTVSQGVGQGRAGAPGDPPHVTDLDAGRARVDRRAGVGRVRLDQHHALHVGIEGEHDPGERGHCGLVAHEQHARRRHGGPPLDPVPPVARAHVGPRDEQPVARSCREGPRARGSRGLVHEEVDVDLARLRPHRARRVGAQRMALGGRHPRHPVPPVVGCQAVHVPGQRPRPSIPGTVGSRQHELDPLVEPPRREQVQRRPDERHAHERRGDALGACHARLEQPVGRVRGGGGHPGERIGADQPPEKGGSTSTALPAVRRASRSVVATPSTR
ncbi:hypothetical protein CMMCAS05_04595 [Clavibacter michiganensis subsp. michiganensis]|nr:hypothetical protein CMMCAS05_04595 [Clavibacter michiganensis subsp. michiganensis]